MDTKYLFTDEMLIAESDNKQISLTSHRLRYQSTSGDKVNTTSFMLEKISSIQTTYQDAVLLLIIGILACLGGVAASSSRETQDFVGAGVVVGLVFIIIYAFSRKHTAVITAECGTKISFEIKASKKEVMYEFINKIEQAKNERFLKAQSQIIA